MKRVWSFVFMLVVIGLLILVLRDFDLYELYLLIAQTNGYWFSLAVLSMFVSYFVWNYRSYLLIGSFFKAEFWYFFKVLMAGAFFNTITPGAGVGGEPFRAYYLAKKYKKPQSKVLGYVLGDSFFRLVALLVFLVFSVLFVLFYVRISQTLTIIFESLLVAVVLGTVIFIYLLLKKSHFKIGVLFKKLYHFPYFKNRFETADALVTYINSRMKRFSTTFTKVVSQKRNIVIGLVLSFIFWSLNIMCAYFLFLAFGNPANVISVVIVFVLGNFIGGFSPSPGGIGVTESSMVLLYSAVGVSTPLAVLVAVLHRFIYYFFNLVIGGWAFVSLRREFNNKKLFF